MTASRSTPKKRRSPTRVLRLMAVTAAAGALLGVTRGGASLAPVLLGAGLGALATLVKLRRLT